MPGRMSGSVSAALSGSGSCDFVPGSGSGYQARNYNLHVLPERASEA